MRSALNRLRRKDPILEQSQAAELSFVEQPSCAEQSQEEELSFVEQPSYAEQSQEEELSFVEQPSYAEQSEEEEQLPAPDENIDRQGPRARIKIPSFSFSLPRLRLKRTRKTVTISTEKDVIRVVVFQGRKVLAWSSACPTAFPKPDRELEPEGNDQDEATPPNCLRDILDGIGIQRRTRFWDLLDKVGIRRGRVVMDLSLYTTLMRHLQIPKVRGRYIAPVVAAEILDSLPFGKDEVDIAWKLQKVDEERTVFAIALPKQRVDEQMHLVKDADLSLGAAYSKAGALALAAGVPNGIVVHLERSESALVLVDKSDPKVVHQIEFGPGEVNPAEQASALVRAIEQVASYYQPTEPTGQSQLLPVILTGQCTDANPIARSLRSQIQRKVLSINLNLEYPEDFQLEEYATNVGLYLADGAITRERIAEPTSSNGSLNLLPGRHCPKPLPVLQTAIFVTLVLLAVHPINISTRVDAKGLASVTISQQLQTMQEKERAHDLVLATLLTNDNELKNATGQLELLEARLNTLQTEMNTLIARLFSITDEDLPPSVSLVSIAPQRSNFNITGTASNHSQTLQYALNLRTNPLFSDARVVRVEGRGGANPDGGSQVNFQVQLSVVQEPSDQEEVVD